MIIFRSKFVSSLAAASAIVAAAQTRLAAAGKDRPISVGLIGCGWFGNIDLDVLRLNANIEVRSLCDVNRHALANTRKAVAARQSREPATYADYRNILKEQLLDLVIIATPDHWHALMAIEAMKSGANLLLEPPIVRTRREQSSTIRT